MNDRKKKTAYHNGVGINISGKKTISLWWKTQKRWRKTLDLEEDIAPRGLGKKPGYRRRGSRASPRGVT